MSGKYDDFLVKQGNFWFRKALIGDNFAKCGVCGIDVRCKIGHRFIKFFGKSG